uniref:Uncharacterized protein n=1 Tax=Arundo donax TaxID=35708 RepID=A0A0A9DJF8_ARUDO
MLTQAGDELKAAAASWSQEQAESKLQPLKVLGGRSMPRRRQPQIGACPSRTTLQQIKLPESSSESRDRSKTREPTRPSNP